MIFNFKPAAYVKPIFPSAQQVSYIGFNLNPNQPASGSSRKNNANKTNDNDDIVLPGVPDNLPSHNNASNRADSFDELSARFDKLRKT